MNTNLLNLLFAHKTTYSLQPHNKRKSFIIETKCGQLNMAANKRRNTYVSVYAKCRLKEHTNITEVDQEF